MPSDNTPGQYWSIRVSRLLPEVRQAMKDIPGVYIGEHPPESGCRRNHYHMYYPHNKIIGHDSFVLHFKKTYNLEALKGNQDFAVTHTTSLRDWFQYVYGGPTGEKQWRQATEIQANGPRPYELTGLLDLDNLIIPPPDNLNEMIDKALDLRYAQKDASKREPCHLRFWKFVQAENYTEMPSKESLVNLWIEWTGGNYELRNVSAPIRYSLVQLEKKFNAGKISHYFQKELREKILSQL